MSRHRAVRNLVIEDILDEEDVSDYEDNQLDDSEMTDEEWNKLQEGYAYIRSIIGENSLLSEDEIKESLWYNYFDKEQTLQWALGTYTLHSTCTITNNR
ncbi:hypothetical protein BDB01DRAFT_431609 [Pilobolus umbonatus]|nr:hypothetical protein BDB01DRAFT_431609 [Pilobolus umbonatus]